MNRDFMEKKARLPLGNMLKSLAANKLVRATAGGAVTAGMMEGVQAALHGEDYVNQDNKMRAVRILSNMIFGGAGALGKEGISSWIAATAAAPVKDIALTALAKDTVGKFTEAQAAEAKAALDGIESDEKKRNLLTALGVGGLGLGGIGLWKYWNKKDPEESGGVLRYKLQGDTPGQEAEVEMPIDSPMMSPNMVANLDAGMRRRLQDTINLNSRKRDPMTGKLIPYTEWKQRYGDADTSQTDYMDGSDFGYAKMASEREYVRQCFNVVKSSAAVPPPPAGGPPAGGPSQGPKKVPGNQATREVKPGVSRPMTPNAYKPGADIRNVASNASKLRTQIAQAAGPAAAPRRPGATRQMYDTMKARIMSLRGPQGPAPQGPAPQAR